MYCSRDSELFGTNSCKEGHFDIEIVDIKSEIKLMQCYFALKQEKVACFHDIQI